MLYRIPEFAAVLLWVVAAAWCAHGDEADPAYDAAIRRIAEKNVFAPHKPKPTPPPPTKAPPPETPPEVRYEEVREELVVTGFLWDNQAQLFVALAETRDGAKRLVLANGDVVGDFTVQIVLEDKLALRNTKTTEAREVELGDAFPGAVIGQRKITITADGKTSATTTAVAPPSTTDAVKPAPTLDDESKLSIVERLKARRRQQLEQQQREGK
jgi:hypothetical protein